MNGRVGVTRLADRFMGIYDREGVREKLLCLEEDPVLSNSLISELLNTFQDVEKRRMYPSAAPVQPQCQAGEFLRERHQAEGSAHLVCPEETRYSGG